jgi:high affinity sulfate transporter 1
MSKVSWPKPFIGLKGITWANLPRDIFAGITLAALVIPLNIGYAQVAGLPPETGLYAGIIPLAFFALFTSSRYMVGSPDAPIAALMGATLLGFAPIGDPMRMQYVLALALMCGVLFFIFWLFRLAFLANFLSRAVLVGFITGLGIEVFTNQVRRALEAPHSETGLEMARQLHESLASSFDTTGYFLELVVLFDSIPHANIYSVAIGAGAFAIVRLLKRYAPKVPGALVALALATIVVGVFGLEQKGVGVLGNIPSGGPSLSLPNLPLSDYFALLPGAIAIVGITLAEALLLVRSYDRKYGTKSDGNQVLFAYGVANIAGGVTGSLITGPSASRSAAMSEAGASSQLPSLVAAATIAVVMIFFTEQLASLPTAALAGVVASAVLSLIEIGELRELWRMRQSEFWIAAVCLVSVLALGPLRAVMIAFLLATIEVIRRASMPGTWVLKEAPDGSHFVAEDEEHAPDTPGLIVYRFGAPLYFANVTLFEEQIESLVSESSAPVKWFVLDTEAIVDIDTTGAEVLHQMLAWLSNQGVTVALSRANQTTVSLLEHYHLLQLIGEDRLYPTNHHAVSAYRREVAVIDQQAKG